MPNVNDLKQSKFLTKGDVMPPILATIRGYEQVNVALPGAEPEMKWALQFDELEKPLVLNSTNGQIIAAITGSDDFDGWIGKKIVLYNDPNISYAGRVTGGIRCRAPRNQPAPTPKPAPSATPAPAHGILGKPDQRQPQPPTLSQPEPPGELPPNAIVGDDDVPF